MARKMDDPNTRRTRDRFRSWIGLNMLLRGLAQSDPREKIVSSDQTGRSRGKMGGIGKDIIRGAQISSLDDGHSFRCSEDFWDRFQYAVV